MNGKRKWENTKEKEERGKKKEGGKIPFEERGGGNKHRFGPKYRPLVKYIQTHQIILKYLRRKDNKSFS